MNNFLNQPIIQSVSLKMKQSAIYVRNSTDRQKDEETIKSQKAAILERIIKDGAITSPDLLYADEGFTGSIIERPDLDRLREDAKVGKFEVLYIFDYGRISRDLTDLMIVKDELERNGVIVISLFERITGDEAVDRLLLQIMGAVYEYERKKTAQRFLNGKVQKARRGLVVGYNAPYGHEYILIRRVANRKVKEGYFIRNEEEAKVARMICEWIGNDGLSTKQVVKRLYELKIYPRKRKRLQWSSSQVYRVATNRSLIGEHHYFKTESCLPINPRLSTPENKYKNRHSNKTSRKARDESEWIAVRVPPIIDKVLFMKVQKQLELNKKYSPRCKKRDYLFSGLIRCECGAARTGEGNERNSYYRCTNRHRTYPAPPTCDKAGINSSVLDTVCWQEICKLLTEPSLLNGQLQRFISGQIAIIKSRSNADKTNKALQALNEEERRYAKAYGKKLMSQTIYKEQVQDIKRRRDELESNLRKPDEQIINRLESLNFEDVAESFAKYLCELPVEDKLFTVRKVVDKVIATKERVTICGQIPLMNGLTDTRVGLNAERWDCRIAECRQEHPI